MAVVAKTYIRLCTEERDGNGSFCCRRALVSDVEYGSHLVAIFGIESTRRELYRFGHFRVYKTESFLLSGSEKERTMHLDTVYVNRVFIEATASDVILA